MKQTTFASLNFAAKKKPTRREQFLSEMAKVVPWVALEALLEPHYPKSGRRGRPPMPRMPRMRMLRIHFLQQWYALSDPAIAPALFDLAIRRSYPAAMNPIQLTSFRLL